MTNDTEDSLGTFVEVGFEVISK